MDIPESVEKKVLEKTPSTGRDLSGALQGNAKERLEEEYNSNVMQEN